MAAIGGLRALGFVALAVLPGVAGAQAQAGTWPSKPIRFIAAATAGSGVDIVARIVGQRLAEGFGQQVVVDNRAGVGGNLGAEIAAKSTPDGYTLLLATPAHAINPSLYRKVNYDIVKDFVPVGLLTTGQYCVVVGNALPVRTLQELVAYAKARPGQLNFGSAGRGNATHLAGELFKSAAGVDIVHIPYKGSSPAMVDVMGGQLQLLFPNLTQAMPHIKSGKVRVLASTGEKRSRSMSDLPTAIEAGMPGYVVLSWYGLVAPAGTPPAAVARLNAEIRRVMRLPDMADRLAAEGAEPSAGPPEELGRLIRSEVARWPKVVRDAGIAPE